MSMDRVALWYFPVKGGINNDVRAFTKSRGVDIPIGHPRDVVFGHNIIFAGYGEEAYLVASDDEIESHLIAAFDENGAFLFGLRDHLKDGGIDGAIEMDLGCITEDNGGSFCFIQVKTVARFARQGQR
jgi:hypothetical protein